MFSMITCSLMTLHCRQFTENVEKINLAPFHMFQKLYLRFCCQNVLRFSCVLSAHTAACFDEFGTFRRKPTTPEDVTIPTTRKCSRSATSQERA